MLWSSSFAFYVLGVLLLVLLLAGPVVVEARSKLGGVVLKGDLATGLAPRIIFGDDNAAIGDVGTGLLLAAGKQGAEIKVAPDEVVMGAVHAAGGLSLASTLTAGGVSQWKLVDLDTFDDAPTAWSNGAHSVCGASADFFLGGHCKFGSTTTARVFENLPPHSMVKVTARVHYFDNWSGEALEVSLDDKVSWSKSYNWCPQFLKFMCRKYGIDSCGRDAPDNLSTQVSTTMAHVGSALKVSFASTLAADTDACHTSWGVDDVAVYIK